MKYNEIVSSLNSGIKLCDMQLRVTYYARVSTDSDVQLNSLDNQLNYYENYIKRNPNWTYVSGYSEEGITGVRVDKRDSFKKMINDAKEGKFDLIISKEVSRFSRDLEDSIHYIRQLKQYGVGILFENQNLNTFDCNSELILNIMFNLAQEESKKISSRVKFGHAQAIKQGHILGSNNIIGYKKDNCKLIIVENEAKFVKKVFELYSTGEYGFYKLAKILDNLGYRNKMNKRYDKETLKRIIENPKYKGYYRCNVYEIVDYRTKKRIKNPIEKQNIHKCTDGSIPAIVCEELWDKANNILKFRANRYKNNNNWSGGLKYPLSSKLYCKHDNCNYQRSQGNKKKNRPIWSCGINLKYGIKECKSPIIPEIDLYNVLKKIIDTIIPNKNSIVKNLLNIYQNIDTSHEYEKNIKNINVKIKKLEDKKTFLLDLVFNGQLNQDDLSIQFEQIAQEINNLKNKKNSILKQLYILKDNNYLNKININIQDEINEKSLESFIRKFIDEIIISKINDDRHNIKLDIFLNFLEKETYKTKGAKHIDGPFNNDILYLEKQTCKTIELKRKNYILNTYTYNVYIES